MLAAYVAAPNREDPLNALVVGEREVGRVPRGWVRVSVRAASLNLHDVWTLRGLASKSPRLPITLGCDAAGIDDAGREVVIHAVIGSDGWSGGHELADPGLSVLSEKYDGTFAEEVVVPRANLLPKPEHLAMAEAACLPTAWLTAYRMLFTLGGLRGGDTVLVQGASGGLSTALICIAKASGVRVWVTGRSEESRATAVRCGADAVFENGERLPARVDAVMDSVGAATWDHTLRSVRRQGTIVVPGATSGFRVEFDVARLIVNQLAIRGAFMGTRGEMAGLLDLVEGAGLRPPVHRVVPLIDARSAFAEMLGGRLAGKVVLSMG